MAWQFHTLFMGCEHNHGKYILTKETTEQSAKGKTTGKAWTAPGPATVEMWDEHLAGRNGLGVSPIRKDGKIYWAALDIDVYNTDLEKLSLTLKDHPILLCRTKSGGAHLFFFFKDPLPAITVRKKLQELASSLGHGDCEIFPKQSKITSKDDSGNWINVPYYDHEVTTRYCIYRGKDLTAEEFLAKAYEVRMDEETLVGLAVIDTTKDLDLLPDGPPCLQLLLNQGIMEGQRDVAMFNVAVCYRKKFTESWRQELEKTNRDNCKPPLNSEEIGKIIKSVERKDYFYQCNNAPLKNYCNRQLCMTRPFGINPEDELPDFSGLTKVETDPPMYFVTVNEDRLGPVSANELLNQRLFQTRCFEGVNIVIPQVAAKDWRRVMTTLTERMDTISIPEEMTAKGQLLQHLHDYCDKNSRPDREKLVNYKVWEDDRAIYNFRIEGFMRYLEQVRFREFTRQQVVSIFHNIGMKKRQLWVKQRHFNVWLLPKPEYEEIVHETPHIEEPPF